MLPRAGDKTDSIAGTTCFCVTVFGGRSKTIYDSQLGCPMASMIPQHLQSNFQSCAEACNVNIACASGVSRRRLPTTAGLRRQERAHMQRQSHPKLQNATATAPPRPHQPLLLLLPAPPTKSPPPRTTTTTATASATATAAVAAMLPISTAGGGGGGGQHPNLHSHNKTERYRISGNDTYRRYES